VDRMIDTENALVSEQLEKRLADMERKKRLMAEKIENLSKPAGRYDEKFEHALTFLANPYKIWKNGSAELRKIVLKLAFTERLAYCRKDGLRTPKTSIPFSILGDFLDGQKEMAHRGCDEMQVYYAYISIT